MRKGSGVLRRLGGGAVVAAVALFALSGCSGGGDADKPRTATPTQEESVLAGEDLHVLMDEAEAPAMLQDPGWVALRFLTTWSRPDVPYDQWWADLEPLLNAQGLQAYAGTDPAVVPRLVVTGELEVVPSTVPTSSMVWVPTNEGRFGVQLSRPTEHAAWLVSRVYFPGTAPDAGAGMGSDMGSGQ